MKDPFLSVYGHTTLDQIMTVRKFPDPNTSEDVLTKTSSLGGTGPNIAVAAARLGCPTALCALVGRDFPEAQREFIERSGVIMDEFVTVDDYETSTAVVINDPGLTQKVLFFQGPQGIASELGIELTSNARRSKHVHLCTGDPEFYIDVMLKAERARKSLDPAQESHRIWNTDNFNRALPLADAVFCNNFEAESLCRYAGKADILDLDKELVVCTQGSKGSIAKINGEVLRIPAVEADRIVDATGCGDTYRAGFYAALYRGYPVPEALVVASAVASFVIEETGALTNVPSWEMAEARAEPYLGQIH
ncbi:MAG: carbohydrate kinase family protein [Thermoplasmata archaeon]|nr:carbohydrate kinase family protein [Thermoplasmata archaeon]